MFLPAQQLGAACYYTEACRPIRVSALSWLLKRIHISMECMRHILYAFIYIALALVSYIIKVISMLEDIISALP